MKMTKGFRSFVAMLAMTAMLLENTATVFAAETVQNVPEQSAEMTTGAEAEAEGSEAGQIQSSEGSPEQAQGEESQATDENGTVPNVEITVGDSEPEEEAPAMDPDEEASNGEERPAEPGS